MRNRAGYAYDKKLGRSVARFIPRAEYLPMGRKRVEPPRSEELAAFGEAIRATRRKKFMSQTKLAEMFGTIQVRIGEIERGRIVPWRNSRKILFEKLRIWVETNKSVLERQREEGSALNDLNRLIKEQKENQNAGINPE